MRQKTKRNWLKIKSIALIGILIAMALLSNYAMADEKLPTAKCITEKPSDVWANKSCIADKIKYNDKYRKIAVLTAFTLTFFMVGLLIWERKIVSAKKSYDLKKKEVVITLKNKTVIIRKRASNIFVVDDIKGSASDFRLIDRKETKIKDISKGISLHKLVYALIHEKVPIMVRLGDDVLFILKEKDGFRTLLPGESVKITYKAKECQPDIEVRYTEGKPPHDPEMEKKLLKHLVKDIADEELHQHHDAFEKLQPIKEKLSKPKSSHEAGLKHKIELVEGVLEHMIYKKQRKTRQQRIDDELEEYLCIRDKK